jgi:hypothetical protein
VKANISTPADKSARFHRHNSDSLTSSSLKLF